MAGGEMSPRRRRNREKRTLRILRKAMHLVETEGVDCLTIHRLAKQLDYTVGALYRYFSSKDELVATLQCDGMTALQESMLEVRRESAAWLEEHAVPTDVRLLVQVWALGEFYAAFAQTGSAHYHLLSMVLGHPEPVVTDSEAVRVLEVTQPIFQDLTELLDEAAKAGALEVSSSVDRALVLWSSLYGLMQVQKVGRLIPDWMNRERLLRQLLSGLLRGWGASPEAMDEAMRWAGNFRGYFPMAELATLDKYSKITGEIQRPKTLAEA